jgi:hypothetical protein
MKYPGGLHLVYWEASYCGNYEVSHSGQGKIRSFVKLQPILNMFFVTVSLWLLRQPTIGKCKLIP